MIDITKKSQCRIKTNVFLSGKEYFPEFNRAYSEFFAGLELPARRTIVAELVVDDSLVEIDAIAYTG